MHFWGKNPKNAIFEIIFQFPFIFWYKLSNITVYWYITEESKINYRKMKILWKCFIWGGYANFGIILIEKIIIHIILFKDLQFSKYQLNVQWHENRLTN